MQNRDATRTTSLFGMSGFLRVWMWRDVGLIQTVHPGWLFLHCWADNVKDETCIILIATRKKHEQHNMKANIILGKQTCECLFRVARSSTVAPVVEQRHDGPILREGDILDFQTLSSSSAHTASMLSGPDCNNCIIHKRINTKEI
jgi:hypothetical protein